jgi:HK97 family phage major capsid protein
LSLTDDLLEARTTARTRADELVTRAAEEERDLTTDELGEYRDAVGSEREAADRIEQLRDDQIRELRASVARTPETRPALGDLLLRAIDESGGAGAAATPPEFAGSFWDALMPQSVGLASGFTVVTTTRDSLVLPVWLADTSANWTAEGDTISSTDANADTATATPFKCAGLQQISNEALADSSPSLGAQIAAGLVRSVSLKLDYGFFHGSGTPPEPEGLANVDGIQFVPVGGAPEFDDIATAIELLESENATPGAIVMEPRAWGDFIRIKELTTGSNKPALMDSAGSVSQGVQRSIYGVPVFVSSQLDPNEIFVYDPAQVVVVRREDVRVETDSSRLFNSDESEIRAITRVDIVVPNPKSVVLLTGVS